MTRTPPTSPPRSLAQAAAHGGLISITGQALRLMLQVGGLMVLARLLTPTDYGVMALGMVVVFLGEVLRDSGLSVVATAAPSLSRGCRDGLWWVNVALAAAVYALVVGVVAPASVAWQAPGLATVLPVLGLSLLLQGCAAQFRVSLVRDLRFTALTIIEVAAAAGGLAMAVWQAAAGRGVWALVSQVIVTGAVTLVGVWGAARWLPTSPAREGIGTLWGTGAPMVVSQVVAWAGKNVDTALLGLSHSTSVVGGYSRAWNVVMMPLTLLRTPATQVAVPLLRSVRDEPHRLVAAAAGGLAAITYPVGLMVAVAVAARQQVVAVVLGDSWAFIAPTVALLAVGSLFDTLAFSGFWLCTITGSTRTLAYVAVVTTVLRGVGIVAGLPWGAPGVAAGIAAAALVSWPISVVWTSRSSCVPARPLLLVGLRALVVTGVAAAIAAGGVGLAHTTLQWPDLALVGVALGGTLVGVGVSCAAVPGVRYELGRVVHHGWRAARGRSTHGDPQPESDQGGEQRGKQHIPAGIEKDNGVHSGRFAQRNTPQHPSDQHAKDS